MFGRSSGSVVFERYGRRRSRWPLPRWLVLLLAGIAMGAAGVVMLQERYLPPRLSADASVALRKAYEKADGEMQRQQAELDEATTRLAAALAERKAQADALGASQASAIRAREDLALVVASLPPDPRGGAVEIRAGRFAVKGGMLVYDVVLTHERRTSKATPGVIQFVVAGQAARGGESTLEMPPIALSADVLQVLNGRLAFPEGFKPQHATIRVLDRVAGKTLGMRVLPVK